MPDPPFSDSDEPTALDDDESDVPASSLSLPPSDETEPPPEEVVEFIETAPAPIRRVLLRSVAFSGPMPPPEMLADYERHVPGTAAAIINAYTKEGDHRRSLDIQQFATVSGEAKSRQGDRRLGMWLALIIALSFLGGSVYLIDRGHEVSGSLLGGSDLLGLVSVFILGRRTNAAGSRRPRPGARSKKTRKPPELGAAPKND